MWVSGGWLLSSGGSCIFPPLPCESVATSGMGGGLFCRGIELACAVMLCAARVLVLTTTPPGSPASRGGC